MSYNCRYCYEDFTNRSEVLCPCDCDGSMKYVCKKCFTHYIDSDKTDKRFNTCPSCKQNYKRNTPDIDNKVEQVSTIENMAQVGLNILLVFLLLVLGENEIFLILFLFIIILSLLNYLAVFGLHAWSETLTLIYIIILFSPREIKYAGFTIFVLANFVFASYYLLDKRWVQIYKKNFMTLTRSIKTQIFDRDLNRYVYDRV